MEQEMQAFLQQHQAQLVAAQVPERLWPVAYYKLKNEVFDAGNYFFLARDEDGDLHAVVRDDVDLAPVQPDADEALFLVDHAWTFTADKVREQLEAVPPLLEPEDASAIWYVMDEVGSAIEHGDEPNVRMAPFYFGPSQCAFSLVWTVQPIEGGDFLSRDYFPEYAADASMHTALLAALFYEPGKADSPYVEDLQEAVAERKQHYSLESARTKFHAIVSRDSETLPDQRRPSHRPRFLPSWRGRFASCVLWWVYTLADSVCSVTSNLPNVLYSTDLQLVHDNLTHPRFTLVDNEDEAQVVWSTRHLKDFPKYTTNENVQIINQFPNEKILTCKDLLYEMCKLYVAIEFNTLSVSFTYIIAYRQNDGVQPDWLAETYNMTSEFPQLIAQFIHRDLVAHENGDDDDEANHWICKPWNMARSIDTCIAQNAAHLARLTETGPKIACNGVYWLRIANKEFTMDNFQDFETHFTVMNYSDFAVRIMDNAEFVERFDNEYPSEDWSMVFTEICSTIKKLFECATAQPPPLGLGRCTKSRALYGVDLMLSWEADEETGDERLRPIILETNFQPDCTRACNCVPPLGPKLQQLFTEDEFLVLHPSDQRSRGENVLYGEPLVLVNQHGMVWNNKTGGITGYVGPRPRNVPGEMFVCFTKVPAGVGVTKSKKDKGDKLDKLTSSASTSVLSASGSLSMSENLETETGPVCFGDSNVAITVVESNRHSQMFNKRLSNFKKPTSKIAGGYICCDGKGTELRFAIWPIKPKIEQISMLNKLITPYNYGQKIALPLGLLESTARRTNTGNADCKKAVAEIFFQLSNGAEAVLPGTLLQQKIMAHAKPPGPNEDEPESAFELPLKNGPGELVVRLTGIAPRKIMRKLATKNEKHHQFHRLGLVVLVLVMLPAFYVAVKVDHPFSSLFQPPVFEPEVDDTDYSSPTASGTLKLIVTDTSINISEWISVRTLRYGLEATGSVPMRFINAEKGDEAKALERYNETTEWRREEGVDSLLEEPSPHFKIIKENYPHYYHKRGKNGEPVYYEKPGKINLKALKSAGLTLDDLMHNYLMITEFLWQVIEQDDNRKGISVLDVDGIGISDFAGEAVEYVRKAAQCRGMVDDVTREKVIIVRGKKKIFEALSERIPAENIPVEYGGTSDGKSPEEDLLFNLMAYVNNDEDAPSSNPIEEILKKKPIKH
ncbi:Tubulin--tyrosine ligase-like protein 12 [Phytophthora cactorum]|nr:Tubulin--tyrosine ligase-like protein 12 [Phytophthora cactorum]